VGRPLHTILLVEDDPDIQLVTRLSLEIGGNYRVAVCASGAQALQIAAADPPDLILLDVMMPGMDGPATMKALRNSPGMPAVPVVFFTANTQAQAREELMGAGALGLIVKPIEPNALVAQVRALWKIHTGDADSEEN